MKLHMQILIALGLGIKRNWHIFFGIIAGILVGLFLYSHTSGASGAILNLLNFIGQVFIRLIQMVVIPLVVSAIIIGITSVGDNKQLGKFGAKMIIYYAIITVIAVTIGTAFSLIFKPGSGAAHYISQNAATEVQATVATALQQQQGKILDLFLNFIPNNPIQAFADGNMVSIILFVVLFALALAKVGDVNRPIVSFFESVFAATMKVTDWIMIFAAPGVFALTASAIASFGMDIFLTIGKYVLVLFAGFAVQMFIIYPLFLRCFSKVSATMLFSAIAEAMMVAFGTASSSATLPLTIACCEKRGISHKISSFVLPLGATLNFDGTALQLVVATIFLAQAYHIHLTISLIIAIGVLAIIASSTCAGIPGGGIITISLILNGMGLTPEQLVVGIAFIFAIDRITDMVRTVLNVTSDAVVAATIADNENEINYDLLNNPQSYEEIA
ncbi:MAG: dicarboxylate/amino acid:cation symporter [Cyanobacteriota bacterium]|nr:dicarboxylate/amino acid:cation symporter [Cyanobacteriota bacterium]